jgi:GMP synthase PP-ATPase subunit
MASASLHHSCRREQGFTNELRGINGVTYDITGKPPG